MITPSFFQGQKLDYSGSNLSDGHYFYWIENNCHLIKVPDIENKYAILNGENLYFLVLFYLVPLPSSLLSTLILNQGFQF